MPSACRRVYTANVIDCMCVVSSRVGSKRARSDKGKAASKQASSGKDRRPQTGCRGRSLSLTSCLVTAHNHIHHIHTFPTTTRRNEWSDRIHIYSSFSCAAFARHQSKYIQRRHHSHSCAKQLTRPRRFSNAPIHE